MPDSVVNVAAAFSIIFPVRTVYFAPAGALEVSGRMLPGESRSQTSQERVGCGLQGRPPAGIVHEARESAQGTSACFHLPRASAKRSSKKAGSRRFWPKRPITPAAPGSNPEKVDFNTISSMNALPFSRTIPVRTPQSASRTEESKSWMSRGLVADRRSYPN